MVWRQLLWETESIPAVGLGSVGPLWEYLSWGTLLNFAPCPCSKRDSSSGHVLILWSS